MHCTMVHYKLWCYSCGLHCVCATHGFRGGMLHNSVVHVDFMYTYHTHELDKSYYMAYRFYCSLVHIKRVDHMENTSVSVYCTL